MDIELKSDIGFFQYELVLQDRRMDDTMDLDLGCGETGLSYNLKREEAKIIWEHIGEQFRFKEKA